METNKGFSLMEIMVIIAILAVISFFSFQGIQSLVGFYRLYSTVQDIHSLFMEARFRAVMKQKDYGIRFDESNQELILFSETENRVESYSLPSGLQLSAGEFNFGGQQEVIFKPLGTSATGRLVLGNKQDLSYEVTVYGPTGRVRYQKKETG